MDERIHALEDQAIAPATAKPPPPARPARPASRAQAIAHVGVGEEGLTQPELCKRFDLKVSTSNLSRHAKGLGFDSSEAYLRERTGWRLEGRKWFPPD